MNNEEIVEIITSKIEEYIRNNFTDIKNNSAKSKDTIEIIIDTELKKHDL